MVRREPVPSLKYLFETNKASTFKLPKYEIVVDRNEELDEYRRMKSTIDYVLEDGKVKVKLNKKLINPILIIMSPRDIKEVKQAFDKINYIDKVWFKYYDKPSLLMEIKEFLGKYKEYTHLIIVSDDVVCPYDSVKTLVEDLLVYNFPVLSGCFNFCNMWMNRRGYCTWCKNKLSHKWVNIMLKPIPIGEVFSNLDVEGFVTEKWRRANPIIKRVWFQGFALGVIRRDVYEQIGFKCQDAKRGLYSTDLPWAVDCAKAGIPQYCDFGVKLHHRAYPQYRYLLVGKKQPKIIFQPATKSLSQVVNFEKVKTPTKFHDKYQDYQEYLNFVETHVKHSSHRIPNRPRFPDSNVFDWFQKRSLNQREWDEVYGKWKSFIEGEKLEMGKHVNSEVYGLSARKKKYLNVLLLIDQFGWAFDFGARGIRNYSKHNCVIRRFWNDLTVKDIRNADVIFPFNAGAAQILQRKPYLAIVKELKPRICVGVRASPMEFNVEVLQRMNADAIGCNSKEAYDFLSERNLITDKKLYLIHSAVDHTIFKPDEHKIISRNKFVVGWCGNSTRKVKRTCLLPKLDFQILVKSDWGRKFFVKGRSQEPMAEWYRILDAFIFVSESEGSPQPILESMASGLPVISTAVGAIPELLDKEWIVPVYPEEEVIKQINAKLQLLKDDLQLRKKVGERNRQKILNTWSWKHIVKRYDRMFEGK